MQFPGKNATTEIKIASCGITGTYTKDSLLAKSVNRFSPPCTYTYIYGQHKINNCICVEHSRVSQPIFLLSLQNRHIYKYTVNLVT